MSQTDPVPPADGSSAAADSNQPGAVWPQIVVGALIGAAALGLAAFIVTRGSGLPDDPNVDPVDAAQTAAAPYVDPLADWEQPLAAVVFTGEVHGYLEPCGCSEKQNGGVARRSALFKELREERGWEVLAADLGGTVRRNRLQTELKFAAMRRAMDEMGYGVLNLGPEELRLGADYLLQHSFDAPPLIGANVSFYGDLTGDVAASAEIERVKILEAGGLKIGFTGVVGDTMGEELNNPAPTSMQGVFDVAEALPRALEELADCDVKVLLSQAYPEQTTKFLQTYPGFDVAVTAGGPEDPSPEPEIVATDAGDALLLRVGHKGKNAGVLGLYPPKEGQDRPRLAYGLAILSKARYGHDEEMDPIMAGYQQSISDNVEAIFEDLAPSAPPRPGGYVGAAKCGECHTKAYAKWKESPHAHALASLTEGREHFEGDWADRRLDPECLSCHVTGWNPQEYFPYEGGYLPERIAKNADGAGLDWTEGVAGPDRHRLLQNQQCENCHGPGSGHVATFTKWKADPESVPQRDLQLANRAMHIDLATASQSTCVKCHDGDNSPDFDFAEYWPKIAHPWRD